MTSQTRELWELLPTDVWLSREKVEKLTNAKTYRPLYSLFKAGLIDSEWRDKDENGLCLADKRQYLRKKTIQEIVNHYNNITNPNSPDFNERIFLNLMVKAKGLKPIKYANWSTYGGDGRKRKPDPKMMWVEDDY